MRGFLLCLQEFVRSPHFTQKGFFSESGFTMLSESVAMEDSITLSPVYPLWSFMETACASQFITDMRACWNLVVLRRCTAKDTIECWCAGGIPRSETASKPGLRFLDVVEEGRVESASCFACSWSSRVEQHSFFPQQVEDKNLSEPHEVAAVISKFQSSS